MNDTSPEQSSANVPSQPASIGLGMVAGLVTLAAVMSGLGAILGLMIGRNDGMPGDMFPLALVGMVLCSLAAIGLVTRPLRRRYIAALPMFWLLIASSIIARWLGYDSTLATAIFLPIAIVVGQVAGEIILKRP